MNEFRSNFYRIAPDWALLIIRIALGVVFMAHGSMKLFGWFGGHGIPGTIGMVDRLGFPEPAFFGWLVIFTEFFGGLALIFGLFTRLASAAIAFDMLVAIVKVHGPNGFFLPRGFEFAFVLMLISISLILSGAGKISLDWLVRWFVQTRRQRTRTE